MLTTLFKHWSYRVFTPGSVLRKTYEAFQKLLSFDNRCHELMAEIESIYYQGKKEDFSNIFLKYDALAESVNGMVSSLEEMAPGSYVGLPAYFRKFDFYSRFFLVPPPLDFGPPFVLEFAGDTISIPLAGSKTTNLVEIGDDLELTIPCGFVITTNSFNYLLEYNDLRPAITSLLSTIDLTDTDQLSQISSNLMALIRNAEIPPDIQAAIEYASRKIREKKSPDQLVAVRSSALSEDGQCSFAGQYASYLNIMLENLPQAYLKVISSKYSHEALAYRINCGLSDEEAPMAVMILEMVDASCAGVLYTEDPSGIQENTLFVHATDGLGDAVVSGTVIPDVFTVDKTSNKLKGVESATQSACGNTLTESQLLELSREGLLIEHHFGAAQDIEWAMHKDGSLIFLQSRSLQITKPKKIPASAYDPDSCTPLFCAGVMAASGIGSGKAWRPDAKHPLENLENGAILVIGETLPSYVKILHKVNGVIAELGSTAGHFATVCREFGVPLLLGVGENIHLIDHGQGLTLSADDTTVYPDDTLAIIKKVPSYERDKDLPFYRKLRSILDFITPLKLVDPHAADFTPEGCRSLHDIIRFSHEMAVQSMFSIGDRWGGRRGVKKKLQTELPFEVFLVDVGGGLDKRAAGHDFITVDLVHSTPFQALWRGLNHPDISWGEQTYYDWKSYDQLAMSDAFAFQSSSDSASYAVLGKEYLNINIRFGYHFTVVDALCEPESPASYCTMRFAGGGGDFAGRELRILFLTSVLERLDFQVKSKGELLDARLTGISADKLMGRIESLGKLLGVTKQMDMRLKDINMVEQQVEAFFQMV
jgi:pyruvate, water dikinase